MRNAELSGKHPKHKKRRLEMSDGEVSGDSEERPSRGVDLKGSPSGDSDSSPERVRKHKKKRKKHRRKHKQSESDSGANSEAESQTNSPEFVEGNVESRDREDSERRRRNYDEERRGERSREDFQEPYEIVRIKQEPVYEENNRARHYDIPSRQRHSEGRHRVRSEAEHQPRRHHRREEEHPRHERGKTSSSGHRYHDDRPSYRDRRHSEEREREREQPARGRPGRGVRQGSRSQWRDEEEPRVNPSQAIKQERTSPPEEKPGPQQTFEWGKKADNVKTEKAVAPGDKEKPNFGLSGKLTEETNTFNGVVIKYSEPPEARKPRRRWRFYPFKGEKALQTLYIHRQSSYLLGRDRKIADIPIDHPSCSKQHAALQYRLVNFERENGTAGKRVRPYIIDLESANGTFVNNKKIEAKKYVELLEKDVVKFGFSSREYVLLHEHSKDDDYDDVGELDPPEPGPDEAQTTQQ